MDFNTLTADKATLGSLQNYVNRSDIPVTDILTEAQAYIYERLRVREMMTIVPIVISASSNTAAVPADFLDPIQLVPYGQTGQIKELPYVHETAIATSRDASGNLILGTPSRWTVSGTNIVVDVAASAPFGTELSYFARPIALSGSNTTNFLTLRFPSLLRHACMGFAYEQMKDADRATEHLTIAEKLIGDANTTSNQWRRNQRVARPDGPAGTAIAYSILTSDLSLSGSIRNWIGDAELPVELILAEAQAFIYERMRIREMMAMVTQTLSAATSTAALPADFLDPIQFMPNGAIKELPYVVETALSQSTDGSGNVLTGTPSRWTVIGTNMVFDVEALSTYSGSFTYYARPPALSLTNDTNFLTIRFPGLLRDACLGFAYQHIHDTQTPGVMVDVASAGKQSTAFLMLAEKAIQDANATSELARRRQRAARLDSSTVTFDLLTANQEVAGSIRSFLSKDDLPAELILTEAQAFICERLRIREMMALASSQTLSAASATAALPSDFLDPIQFMPNGSIKELPYVIETGLAQSTDGSGNILTGTPSRWTVIGTNMVFDVKATTTYIGSLAYYARPLALSLTNETNFLTVRFPGLLRDACLGFAYQHVKDTQTSDAYLALAEKAIQDANATSELARRRQRAARLDSSVVTYDLLTANQEVAGSIRNLLGKDDLPVELILTEAQAFLYERLRVREMVTSVAFNIPTGASSMVLPSDFLDPISFQPYGWGWPLAFVHEAMMIQVTDQNGVLSTGTPSMWAIIGPNIVFDLATDASVIPNFSGTLLYYQKPVALGLSNESNFLTTRYPTLLRLACETFGFMRLKDLQNANAWRQLAEAEIQSVNATNELERRSQY